MPPKNKPLTKTLNVAWSTGTPSCSTITVYLDSSENLALLMLREEPWSLWMIRVLVSSFNSLFPRKNFTLGACRPGFTSSAQLTLRSSPTIDNVNLR